MSDSSIRELCLMGRFDKMIRHIEMSYKECSEEALLLRLMHWKIHAQIQMAQFSEIEKTINEMSTS